MKFFKSPFGIKLWIEKHEGRYWVHINGRTFSITPAVSVIKKKEEKTDFVSNLKAPFPGRISAVKVKKGDKVEPGQHLIIIESMKMEHTLNIHCKAQVQFIKVKEGQSVEFDEVLMNFNKLETE